MKKRATYVQDFESQKQTWTKTFRQSLQVTTSRDHTILLPWNLNQFFQTRERERAITILQIANNTYEHMKENGGSCEVLLDRFCCWNDSWLPLKVSERRVETVKG